jgi:glycerophosphoryl diester phosphodiesterase
MKSPRNSPRIFAHRGSHTLFQESSLEAYKAAIKEGADGFECDIRLTRDGEIVLWHDSTLERISGAKNRISSSTLDELRALTPIATLDELFDLAIAHKKDIAIETKHPVRSGRAIERSLARLLLKRHEEIKKSGIDIYLMSFSWWATSYNSKSRYTGTFLVHHRRSLPLARFATIGINISILRNGYIPADPSKILVWTANTPEDIALCKKLQVSVIITDNVALAKSV